MQRMLNGLQVEEAAQAARSQCPHRLQVAQALS